MTSRPSDQLAGFAFANLTRLGATIRGPEYPVTSPNRRRSSQSVRASSSPNATFALLSGGGADPTGRSRMAFARYKGEAENALSAAGFPRLHIFRPAHIYPVQPRKDPNVSYRLLRALYPAFRLLFPNQVIRADDLARTMVDVVVRGFGESRTLVLENREIRHLALHSTENRYS